MRLVQTAREETLMLTMIPFEEDHVLGVRLEGKVSKQEYDMLNARMKRCLQELPELSIYTEIPWFDEIPVEATLEDLILAMEHWNTLKKKAVVTDVKSIRVLEPIVNRLSPGIDVRVFDDADADAARAWVVA